MKTSALRSNVRRRAVLMLGFIGVVVMSMALSWTQTEAALVTRTWDGGGATNNWSDAANWSGDVVPTANDDVVFDSTSTKNATVDANSDMRNLNIAAGYTGTITIANSNSLSVIGGTSSSQAAGSIVCSGGAAIIFSNVTYDVTGGSINCANGTVSSVSFMNLRILGGSFTAPLGTMTLGGTSTIEIGATATFISNGTILATGNFATLKIAESTAATLDINNLTIDLVNPSGAFIVNDASDTLRVHGTLTLVRGDTQGTYEALGPVNISDTWGTGNQTGKLVLAGNATRTVTLPTLAPSMSYVPIELNAPNTIVNTSGAGPVKLKSIHLSAGILNTGTIPFSLGTGDFFRQSGVGGGAFICGGLVSLNTVELIQVGGVFNCLNGTIDSNFVIIRINGGTFEAPSGMMTLRTPAPGGSILERGVSGILNTNNGTINFVGGSAQINVAAVPATLPLSDLTLNLAGTLLLPNGLTLGVKDLDQQSGQIFQGSLMVTGNMTVGPGVTANGNTANITFAGNAPQTYANNGGNNLQGDWTIDKSGGTVTLQSTLDLTNGFGGFNLNNGSITTGANVVDLGTRNVTRTNGRVNGNLRRRFTATGIKTFDVGTANGYAPVSVNVTSLGGNPSDLTVGNTQGTHPVLPPNISLGRYWPIIENGNVTANLTFNYLQSDVNGNEGNYKVNRIVGTQVEVLEPPVATVDTNANTATVNGITEFSDWTLSGAGPPLALSPLTPTIGAGFSIPFNATGGVPPYTFSIPTNNSGASINASTGFYVAGATFGVQDIVQLTDSNNDSVTTNVTVIDPFLVVNTNDNGVGSLRQAMLNANGASGSQTIRFNIPGTPPFTIMPASPLPIMTETTIIDGTSQPGYAGAPIIELDGTNANGNGLEIQSGSGSVIVGLAINRFGGNGILVNASQTVIVQGNYIGVGLDGITPRGNLTGGVAFIASDAGLIGGSTPTSRNVISGNDFDGVVISGSVQTNVVGNYIGVGADGTSPAGNGRTGVRIIGGTNNGIGGTQPPLSNVIAFTGTVNPPVTPRGGVVVEGNATGNSVGVNSIHSNVGLGIDLNTSIGGADGVTPNDNCDVDTGPNSLQNFPSLTSATTSGGAVVISGTMNGVANRSHVMRFYLNSLADPTGHGEGKTFIGSAIAITGAGCSVAFAETFQSVNPPPGSFVTATAATQDGTSEFSLAVPVTAVCTFALNPTSQNFNANGGNGTFTVTTDPNCQWTAIASDSFISVVSLPGNGLGTVNFTVSPNTTGAPRSGTITVGGQTFSITQAAVCVFSINPTAQNFGLSGGIGAINVQTNPGCMWTAVSNSSFVTIKSGQSGNGPGDVAYSVAPLSVGSRAGTITVAGRTFAVIQSTNTGGCATGSFRLSTTPVTTSALLESAADVNRDGSVDLLYTNFQPPQVLAVPGNGDGTFAAPVVTDLQNAIALHGMIVADVNDDALVDLVLKVRISEVPEYELRIAMGNGGGGFSVAGALPSNSLPSRDFVVGDFNGDSMQDIVARGSGANARVFLGNGDGTFADPLTRPYVPGSFIRPADINRDGKLDIVSLRSDRIDIFLGNGQGDFATSTSLMSTNLFQDFVAADFNRDGKLDLAATDSTPGPNNITTLKIYLGNGGGGFGPALLLSQVDGFAGIEASDFNRDGKLDLAVAGGGSDYLALFIGSGTGTFPVRTDFPGVVGNSPVVADFNGDGRPDIAVKLTSTSSFIMLNSCGGLTQKPKIDFDGDGKTDIAIWRPSTGEWYVLRSSDGSYFSFVFGQTGDLPTAGDFDGDNKTDAAVFRPSTGTWFILRSTDGGATIVSFGLNGDRPAAGDYDGDGKTDIGVFRPSDGLWWIRRSSDNLVVAMQWGVGTDVVVQ